MLAVMAHQLQPAAPTFTTSLEDATNDPRLRLAGCLVSGRPLRPTRGTGRPTHRQRPAAHRDGRAGPRRRRDGGPASQLRSVAELLLSATSPDGWLFQGQRPA